MNVWSLASCGLAAIAAAWICAWDAGAAPGPDVLRGLRKMRTVATITTHHNAAGPFAQTVEGVPLAAPHKSHSIEIAA